ncbi:MAG: methylated-DNA-[protein]-cysteine S-methyltransferase [Actinomycetota bacterium]|nr:methylated-DNA-[protein]-cysteine S-methyltransferase [Actinomycetota bacterium]MDQ1666094.1 methylated-DNA-[protein]-cysteine S-methyltransferase [Actinomycetota bacterium]MDQ1668710.1 methylated-DNA-[protein]-cysteine S-methyltransferase [Actinomycetota bacterium]
MTTYWTTIHSPVGELLLTSDDSALTRLLFSPFTLDPTWSTERSAVLDETVTQLAAYFAGERTDFDLPLAPAGTPFQLRVWEALREIAYATTINYGQLALRVGNVKASRAVGLANGRNPISIVVPCHRVIGANGSLTGYGGGLDRKRTLLDLERRTAGVIDPADDQLTLL